MQIDNNPKTTPNGEGPKWRAQPVGILTGIDYTQRGSAAKLDPYFVWADVNGFAHLRKAGQDPDDLSHIPLWLPVLLQLKADHSPRNLPTQESVPWLVIPAAFLDEARTRSGAVVPARVRAEFFKQFKNDDALLSAIERVELDLPRNPLPIEKPQGAAGKVKQTAKPFATSASAAKTVHSVAHANAPRALLTGKVIAFIDDGCAFAHAHFLQDDPAQPGTPLPRVKRLWDMNERILTSPHAAPMAYQIGETDGENGREFTDFDLKALLIKHTHLGQIDEDAVYAEFAGGTQFKINRLLKSVAHGTHVMDLACGPYMLEDTMCTRFNAPAANPTWIKAEDTASTAPIIFVQLPMQTVQETTLRGTMQQDVIKALDYILGECAPDAEIVINLSWGTLAGPHTGTNLLEREIDRLVGLLGPRLKVVIPAGNGYQSRTHANFHLTPGQSIFLDWRLQPDDSTESYLELWMEQGAKLELEIITPSGRALRTVQEGDVEFLDYETKLKKAMDPILGVCYNPIIQGDLGPGPGLVLALAPTHSLAGERAIAPHGVWKINVKNVGPVSTVVDGYIERDDDAAGTRRGARQTYFDDPKYRRFDLYDSTGLTAAAAATDPNDSYARREGVFNSLATGYRAIVVGGLRESDRAYAEYSPNDDYRQRPQRADTPVARNVQLTYVVTEESLTLHGVRAAGTRSGSTVRLSGTSMAAPQITRDVINGLWP
jgi:hypothetical protein